MKLMNLFKAAGAETVWAPEAILLADVKTVIAADLMSDVLLTDAARPLLVTALATEQSLRTAHVVGAAAVLVVGGKALPAGMADLAHELDIPLARSPLPKFEVCARLGRALEL